MCMYIHTYRLYYLGLRIGEQSLLDVKANVSLSWHSCNSVHCHGTRGVWQSWDQGGMAVLSYIQYIPWHLFAGRNYELQQRRLQGLQLFSYSCVRVERWTTEHRWGVCGVGMTSHSGGNGPGYTGSGLALLLPLVLLWSTSGPYTAGPDQTLYAQMPLPSAAGLPLVYCYCNALV